MEKRAIDYQLIFDDREFGIRPLIRFEIFPVDNGYILKVRYPRASEDNLFRFVVLTDQQLRDKITQKLVELGMQPHRSDIVGHFPDEDVVMKKR